MVQVARLWDLELVEAAAGEVDRASVKVALPGLR